MQWKQAWHNAAADVSGVDYEVVLTLMFQKIERSATQVYSLAYKRTKVQQLPKTQTHQLINSQTHQLKTLN